MQISALSHQVSKYRFSISPLMSQRICKHYISRTRFLAFPTPSIPSPVFQSYLIVTLASIQLPNPEVSENPTIPLPSPALHQILLIPME